MAHVRPGGELRFSAKQGEASASHDDLIRLIDSFPDIDPATGAFGLRPVALRARLGLSPG